jgi:hypothetical protein
VMAISLPSAAVRAHQDLVTDELVSGCRTTSTPGFYCGFDHVIADEADM